MNQIFRAIAGGAMLATTPLLAQSNTDVKLVTASAINAVLVGKYVAYSPPGLSDAGIHEEFNEDGSWGGIYYSVGPIRFSGKWSAIDGQVCVQPDEGAIVARWFSGQRCRTLFQDTVGGYLLMEDLDPRHASLGPLILKVGVLPKRKI